jgi:hypothetical protein
MSVPLQYRQSIVMLRVFSRLRSTILLLSHVRNPRRINRSLNFGDGGFPINACHDALCSPFLSGNGFYGHLDFPNGLVTSLLVKVRIDRPHANGPEHHIFSNRAQARRMEFDITRYAWTSDRAKFSHQAHLGE